MWDVKIQHMSTRQGVLETLDEHVLNSFICADF